MKKSIIFFIAAILLFTVSAASCDTIDSDRLVSQPVQTDQPPVRQPYPVSFDNESFDKAPQTVISLSPAITDILLEMELQSKLVGVSDYCSYTSAPSVGSPANPDIDKIIELKPELLITQSPLASADVVRLRQEDIRYLYLETPQNFSYLCEEYIRLAMIFYGAVDSKDTAMELLSDIDAAMSQASKSGIDVKYAAVTGKNGSDYIVSTGGDILTDMLCVFGTNILDRSENPFVSKKELSDVGADVVFADTSLDGEDFRSIFPDGTKVIFTDISMFDRPTAELYEVIMYCLAELS